MKEIEYSILIGAVMYPQLPDFSPDHISVRPLEIWFEVRS